MCFPSIQKGNYVSVTAGYVQVIGFNYLSLMIGYETDYDKEIKLQEGWLNAAIACNAPKDSIEGLRVYLDSLREKKRLKAESVNVDKESSANNKPE
jgi:hypothetical protein